MRADTPLEGTPTPISADVAIDLVAGQLDAAFLGAGGALATAYEYVEGLVANLAEVTGAVDHEAGHRAISNMQGLAHRIETLPDAVARRAAAVSDIGVACNAVDDQVRGVARTLEFLRICGLNIKVASAGHPGFSEFADQMLARLDVSENEIRSVRREAQALHALIPTILAVDRKLAEECRSVARDVPKQMGAKALALQDYLQAAQDQATQVASVAARMRSHLAEALGAMQIGDITRQRLEHVATGYRMLVQEIGLTSDDPARTAAARQIMALLEAQNGAAIDDFHKEGRRLGDLQQMIAGDIAEMLTFRVREGAHGSSGEVLQKLEQEVADVASLTEQLQAADARSLALGGDATSTVERLSQRLSVVHRVTGEVDNMAWNTDLRCYRMGQEGYGLARIAVEIRSLVGTLKTICNRVDKAIDRLTHAASAIVDQSSPDAGNGNTLEQSLSIIRAGALRANDSLGRLERQAEAAAGVLGGAVEAVAAIEQLSAPLDDAADALRSVVGAIGAPATDHSEVAEPLLDAIARLYTMASERELHRQFAPAVDSDEDDADQSPTGPADDEEDDGLF